MLIQEAEKPKELLIWTGFKKDFQKKKLCRNESQNCWKNWHICKIFMKRNTYITYGKENKTLKYNFI